LLTKYRPKGLVVVSGDVHVGDVLGIGNAPLEVTSSGLTHSCSDSLPQFLCKLAWEGPARNRRFGKVYLDRNYGTINLDWRLRLINVTVWDIPPSLQQRSHPQIAFSRSMDASFNDVIPESWQSAPGVWLETDDKIRFGTILFVALLLGLWVVKRMLARLLRRRTRMD